MKKSILFLLLITTIMALPSCERDEICIDPITPKMIVAFYDVDNTENKKSVNNLAIEILDVAIENKSLDTIGRESIAIPLNIYDVQTAIVFTANSKDSLLIKRDTILITYQTEEVFVGRSCGYKSVFKNVNIDRNFGNPNNRWIKSLAIEEKEIENENKAHVTILH